MTDGRFNYVLCSQIVHGHKRKGKHKQHINNTFPSHLQSVTNLTNIDRKFMCYTVMQLLWGEMAKWKEGWLL